MWYNTIMHWLIRSPLHFFVSKNMMLLTYTGRKSGAEFTLPVSYLPIGETIYSLSSRERVWWRNLRAAAPVNLRLQGKDVPAQGQAIEDQAEVAQDLIRYFKHMPRMAGYLGIPLGADGQPDPEALARVASERVIVRFRLG